jgi:hypothetical protein
MFKIVYMATAGNKKPNAVDTCIYGSNVLNYSKDLLRSLLYEVEARNKPDT